MELFEGGGRERRVAATKSRVGAARAPPPNPTSLPPCHASSICPRALIINHLSASYLIGGESSTSSIGIGVLITAGAFMASTRSLSFYLWSIWIRHVR